MLGRDSDNSAVEGLILINSIQPIILISLHGQQGTEGSTFNPHISFVLARSPLLHGTVAHELSNKEFISLAE